MFIQSSTEPAPQQTPLELLQQQLVQQAQSLAETTAENQVPISTLTENTLLLQIQALTEQLLASAAVNTSSFQPQPETTSNKSSDKVVYCIHSCLCRSALLLLVMFLDLCFLLIAR